MLIAEFPLARILPSPWAVNPPNPSRQLPRSRLFTQKSQLLLVAAVGSRPQLPFLHLTTADRPSPNLSRSTFRHQISRLLTTERKQYLKREIRKAAKYTVYGWTALSLMAIMAFGFHRGLLERRFPAPPEWTLITRLHYQDAKSQEEVDANDNGFIDWAFTGDSYRHAIERLEDISADGQNIRPVLQGEANVKISDPGMAGLDVSAKSEPWRRGYYTCLMGAAKAAEYMDGWVLDTTRNIVFPPEHVIGSSNPRPKPIPPGAKAPPREENCAPAFESAQFYYLKILTTHGFTARQRLDAAVAYADWLDFKGLSATAEEIYDWGLDIAMGSLPLGVNDVIDIKSGVINEKATYISSNVLLATTALACHHARSNNLAAALPIFLSVLRARRQLPVATSPSLIGPEQHNNASMNRVLCFLQSLVAVPPYPPAPTTGDEVPFRDPIAICEEAGIMSHIGEILFASASANLSIKTSSDKSSWSPFPPASALAQMSNQQSGLSWTRDAVDLAEGTFMSVDQNNQEARQKCSECLAVGVDNWSVMIAKIMKNERLLKSPSKQLSSGSWLWKNGAAVESEGRWEREREMVEERLENLRVLLRKEVHKKENQGGYLFM